METSLNLFTCAAISSFTFSFKRHLSAVLGGGAARRPAWAKSVPGSTIAKISANRQRSVFIGTILTRSPGSRVIAVIARDRLGIVGASQALDSENPNHPCDP